MDRKDPCLSCSSREKARCASWLDNALWGIPCKCRRGGGGEHEP